MAAACAAVCPLGKNIAAAAWPRTNNRFYSAYQKNHPAIDGLEQTTVEDLKYQKNTLAIDGSKQTTDFTQNIKKITLAIDEREVGGSGRVGSSLKHKMIFGKFDRILKNITEIF